MSKLTAIVLFVCAVAQSSFAQSSAQLTAEEILTRVSSVYSSCRSYSDEGEVTTQFQTTNAARPMVQNFTTAFVRPDKFRFEFRAVRGMRFVAWKDGPLQFAEWPTAVRPADIDETLLNLLEDTHGTALTVPALLFPEVFSGPGLFAVLGSVQLKGEEKIEGRRAFKIQASFQDGPLTLWVDTNQFLILKVDRKAKLGRLDQRIVTKYRPAVNIEISPDRLAFNPRKGSYRIIDDPAPVTGEPNPANAPALKKFGSTLTLTAQEIEKLRKERVRHSEDEDVIRVDTDLVVCDVLVVDSQGRSIQNLVAEDFVVKEDNQLQEIGTFSLGNSDTIPRSIVLVIDYSGSQLPYVMTSVEAAKTLVDKLNPRDRMALVTDDVKLLVEFTSDKQLLKSRLDALKTRAMNGWLGYSRQYDALMASVNELFGKEDARPIVIFQTDGDQLEFLSAAPRNQSRYPYERERKFTFEDVLTAAERTRVTVYSIIPGVPFNGLSHEQMLAHSKLDWKNRQKATAELFRSSNLPELKGSSPSDETLMANAENWKRLHLAVARVADITGGWADYLEKPEQADNLYARVLADINQRYVVGYYPKNRTRDGKRRSVTIEIRGHPEYVVMGRKSYLAPQP